MISRKSNAVFVAFATILLGLFSAQAGGDKVAFPENYAKGVKWLPQQNASVHADHWASMGNVA